MTIELKQRWRRRRTALLATTTAGVAALFIGLQSLVAPQLSHYFDYHSVYDHDHDHLFRRFLSLESSTEDAFQLGGYVDEEDYDAAFAAAFGDEYAPSSSTAPFSPSPFSASSASALTIASSLAPNSYTLEDALMESKVFEYTFAIVVYDPPSDKFVGLYCKDHKWKNGNKKLWKSMKYTVYMLRKIFPERFMGREGGSEEFVFALGSGDYPHVKRSMLPHSGKAPVLMFGSSFQDQNMYTNMMAMPMPQPQHLNCFEEWVENGGTSVCKELRPDMSKINPPTSGEIRVVSGGMKSPDDGDLLFGDEYGLEWDALIPQVIWRGTDFGFLPTLQPRPSLVHPDSRNFVRTEKAKGNKRVEAIQALNDKYDTLLPRWKGAALTADAELLAQQQQAQTKQKVLPWADMKFSAYLGERKSPTMGSLKYSAWESVSIGVDHGISLPNLAKYKYHIDLGGGGGTTWSGTIEKLAMPGLLFHHVTPMKDYIHDRMKPWRHYIPVRSDLKDLKAKYDWAESHPVEAKMIADAGTEFMRHLGTPEGFGQMFDEDFVEPWRRVIEAYQPVSTVHPDKSTTWQEVLQSMGKDNRVMPVMECNGDTPNYSCHLVGGDATLKWQSNGLYNPSS